MRIAFFTDTYLPQINGVTNTLSRLVSYLDKKGLENMVFAPAEREYPYETLVDTSFSLRFFLYPEVRLSIPNPQRMSRVLNRFKPDIIHCLTPFNLGLMGMKLSRDYKLPLVASYHTNFDQYLEHYNLKFMQNVLWDYFLWFHNQCQVNYAPSHDTVAVLENKGFHNVELWSRGVDTDLYRPEKRKSAIRQAWGAEGKIVLLYVGRLAPEKNLSFLMNSFRQLQSRYGDRIQLVMTGDGPLLEELRQEGLPNVIFTGYKKGAELAEIYASADIFIFPSMTETFGNVVLEAMSSGLPVMALAAGGVKDTVKNLQNGLLCQSEDLQGFVSAGERLIEQDSLRQELSQGARAYALSQSWEHIFSTLVDSYQSVVINRILHTKSA